MSAFPPELLADAEELLELCRKRRLKIATAESCTGGLVAGLLTSIAGSSDVFERGFVTYSNEAKVELLGVAEDTLKSSGAVSAETARAMAEGALKHSHADIAVSVTGVAGPGGGSPDKPVGLVFIGTATKSRPTQSVRFEFGPLSRADIRMRTVVEALRLLRAAI
jgi:nicotinamide-nucleotide amidase